MFSQTLSRKGFSIAEVVIVVTLVAIVTTIGFRSYQTYTVESRNAHRVAQLNNISRGIALYKTNKGFYPIPSNGVTVTYSGATLWTQGTFGASVFTAIENPGEMPRDISTNSEFSYSVSALGTEYQVAGVLESPTFLLQAPVDQAFAAGSTLGKAYVTGKFNWKVLPADTGTTIYIVAVPSMIASSLVSTDYAVILSNNRLVYDGYSNIPASYANTMFTQGSFTFTPPEVQLFAGSKSDLYDEASRVAFLKNIKDAYTGTNIASQKEIAGIISLTINESDPSDQAADLACSVIGSVLGQTGACNTLFAGTGSGTIGEDAPDIPIDLDVSNLPDDDVNTIYVAANGDIWFGTDGGIGMYNGETWITYTEANSDLADDKVLAITQDISGNMWFGTDNGLNKLSGVTWTTYTSSNSGLEHNRVFSAYCAANGDMRFDTKDGLSRLVGTTWTTYTKSNSGLTKDNKIDHITSDHNGYMWFATDKGANRYAPGTNTWTTYRKSDGLASDKTNYILEDSNDDIWVGTNTGLNFIDFPGLTYSTYKTNNSGIVNNNVKSIFQDSRGYLWIGTGGGLSQKVSSTWTNYETPDGLAGNVVYSIYEEADTDIVILTEGGATTIDF